MSASIKSASLINLNIKKLIQRTHVKLVITLHEVMDVRMTQFRIFIPMRKNACTSHLEGEMNYDILFIIMAKTYVVLVYRIVPLVCCFMSL
jgi:hypothetical protein